MKRSLLATAFVIVVCQILPTNRALAVPISYTVNTTIGDFLGPDPLADPLGLAGSQFTIEYEWDPSSLTPTFDAPFGGADRVTVWPGSNTSINLTIAGSTSADGTYSGAISGGSSWQLRDNDSNPPPLSDDVQFPSVTFALPGNDIDVAGLNAFFSASFNTPASPGTVFPYPFQASDVNSWQDPGILYLDAFGIASGQNTSGSATVVPEPQTILGSLIALGGMAFLRRKWRVPT